MWTRALVAGIVAVLAAALQEIVDNNDDPFYPGTRAAGTEGYQNSVEYVADLLTTAGYDVTLDPVEFEFNFPAVLRQLTPVEATYETVVFTGSGSGTVEGQMIPVDINLEGDRASDSGCTPDDFAGIDWSGDADIAIDPAGHAFLRHEGVLRRASRRRGGHHLQPGQHTRA